MSRSKESPQCNKERVPLQVQMRHGDAATIITKHQPRLFALAQPCCLLDIRFLGISTDQCTESKSGSVTTQNRIAAKRTWLRCLHLLTFTWIQDSNRMTGLRCDMAQTWTCTSTHQANLYVTRYRGLFCT